MIRRRLFEFSVHVCPTSGEYDLVAIFFAKTCAVRLRCIANDNTLIALHERAKCDCTLVVANSMHDDLRRCDAPHLPRLVFFPIETWPARLIETDDGLRQRTSQQCCIRRFESTPEHVELIPECLRRDHKTVTRHDALLSRERNVIEILVDRDFDREVERVTAAGNGALGSERRLDAAAALARVLLLLDLNDTVAHLDDVDHLRRLELIFHRRELAAARRACLVRLVELEDLLDLRQLWLRRVSELRALLLFFRLGRGLLVGFHRRCAARLLFELEQRLLECLRIVFERFAKRANEQIDLRALRERHEPELLDVFFAAQVDHVATISFVSPLSIPPRTFFFSDRAASAHMPAARGADVRRARSLR